MAITLINAFTVPLEESDRFLASWKERAHLMAGQPGFIRARMHRAIHDDAELRFVNVAEWESEEHLAAALADPEWQASVKGMRDDPDLHITARPATYRVELDLGPILG